MSNQRLKVAPALEALSFEQTPARHLAEHTFGLRRVLWSTNPTRSVEQPQAVTLQSFIELSRYGLAALGRCHQRLTRLHREQSRTR